MPVTAVRWQKLRVEGGTSGWGYICACVRMYPHCCDASQKGEARREKACERDGEGHLVAFSEQRELNAHHERLEHLRSVLSQISTVSTASPHYIWNFYISTTHHYIRRIYISGEIIRRKAFASGVDKIFSLLCVVQEPHKAITKAYV